MNAARPPSAPHRSQIRNTCRSAHAVRENREREAGTGTGRVVEPRLLCMKGIIPVGCNIRDMVFGRQNWRRQAVHPLSRPEEGRAGGGHDGAGRSCIGSRCLGSPAARRMRHVGGERRPTAGRWKSMSSQSLPTDGPCLSEKPSWPCQKRRPPTDSPGWKPRRSDCPSPEGTSKSKPGFSSSRKSLRVRYPSGGARHGMGSAIHDVLEADYGMTT